ncbi:hypothetical protein GCM10008179_06780 [Hansschlegelia plantiphila]|uniref:Uncharacterized protein n=1 Tax=Hansschlegelia plantiphila TaxID=374655 RepID=A0A9W6J0I9_9HYPH|nr:hypothetical protein GCM10008179_06780 [Hansschlegelia plantiphila]
MPLDFQIAEDDLGGFTAPAREHLKKAVEQYAVDLIKEANRIEATRNSTDGTTEITQGMVNDAVSSQKQTFGSPKITIWPKILNAVSSALSFIVGMLYDPSSLTNQVNMLIFLGLAALTIIVTTISIMRGS